MAEKKRGLRNTRVWKRFAAICMAVVMAVTMLPIIPGAKDVYAAPTDYTVDINLYDYNKTDLVDPEEPLKARDNGSFYVIAVAKGGLEGPTGNEWTTYAIHEVPSLEYKTTTVSFAKEEFRIDVYEPEGSTNFVRNDYKEQFGQKQGHYDPTKYRMAEVYLCKKKDGVYYVPMDRTSLDEYLNKYLDVTSDAAPEGYKFLPKTVDNSKGTVNLYRSQFKAEYELRLSFSQDAGPITADQKYCVILKVEHNDTMVPITYYVAEDITYNGTDIVIPVKENQWLNQDGNPLSKEKFTGNELSRTVFLVKKKPSEKPITKSDLVKMQNSQVDVIPVGGPVGSYTYDRVVSSSTPNSTTHVETFYDELQFSPVSVDTSYTFLSVLGPSAYFGVTAASMSTQGHFESNFATNHFTDGDANFDPDLSNDGTKAVPGTILVAQIGDEAKTPEEDKNVRVHLGNRTPETAYVITTEASRGKVTNAAEPGHAVVTTTEKSKITSAVNGMIGHMQTVSADLFTKPVTSFPGTGADSLVVDISSYPDNAVVYIDGDKYKKAVAASGGVQIICKDNQLVVFNFDETSDIEIGKVIVNGLTSNTKLYNWEDELNHNADYVNRHVVWNMKSPDPVNKPLNVTLKESGGIYLLPDDTSYIDAGGTSTGWVVSAGHAHMGNGEFHFVYQGMNSNSQANLSLKKTVDGQIPTTAQKFTFVPTEYNWQKHDFDDITIGDGEGGVKELTAENSGTTITIPLTSLKEGPNIIRISENPKAGYKDKKLEFYASFDVMVVMVGGVEVKIPGAVTYYKNFNKATAELTDKVSGTPVFENEKLNVDTAKLSITKTFGGAVVEADKDNLSFEVKNINTGDEYSFTLDDFETTDNKTYTLKTDMELPLGTYTVTEKNYDSNGAGVSVSYVIGTTSTDGAVANNIVLDTKDQKVVVEFKNQYPSTNVKLSKQAITPSGTEVAGAKLTLTGTVGTSTTSVTFNLNDVKPGAGAQDVAVSTDGKTLSWTSGTAPTEVQNLPNGKYTLHEVAAPDGFAVASDFKFVVLDGKVYEEDGTTEIDKNTVIMRDAGSTTVVISKVMAGTTTELAGATLTLAGRKADGSGAITFDLDNVKLGTGAKDKALSESDTKVSWVSGTGATTVEKLPNGIYTLTETTAPQGFAQSEVISFFLENGKVYEIKEGAKGAEITDKKITMEDAFLPIEVQIAAKKTLENDTLVKDQFSFNLKGTSSATNAVDETVGNAADGSVTFTEISYNAVGKYEYKLTEVKPATLDPDITYSAEEYTVTVDVTATATGLAAKVTYTNKAKSEVEADKVEFVNTKKTEVLTDVIFSKVIAGTTTELAGATLTLTGTKPGSTDAITFKTADVALGTGATLKTTADGTSIEWISGTAATKVKNLPNGTYTLTETTAPQGFDKSEAISFIIEDGKVYESKNGTKGAEITNKKITMEDAYTPVKVQLTAKKTLQNDTLTANQFSFNLKGKTPDTNTVDETVGNAANGDVTFTEIAYSAVGTYTYELTEVEPATKDPNITYSDRVYTITVTVSATDTGLKTTIAYADQDGVVDAIKPEFVNVKKTESKTDVRISKKAGTAAGAELAGATLTLTGVKAGSTDKVTFKLTDVQLGTGASFVSTVDGDTLSWISGTESTEIKNLPDGTYTLHEVTAPNANGFKVANDMYFILENGEVYASDAQGTKGSKIGNSTIVMVDEYQPISVDLAATKKLMEGNTEIAQTAGDFQFKLSKKADSGEIQTSSNAADGTVTFRTINYNAPAEDEYVIEEVPGNIKGITYDTKTKYTVTVKITAGAKGLEKEVIYNNGTSDVDADKVVFTNMKAPDVGTLQIKKKVKGTTLDSVKVMITTGQGASQKYLTASGTLVDAETHITVSTKDGLTIENVPVGEYTVTEVADSTIVANYTLVTTGADGSKTTETKIVEKNKTTEVELINSYERDKGKLQVTKTINGNNIPKTEFKITIKNGEKYLNASGALVDTDPKLMITAGVPLLINDVPTGNYTVTEDTEDAKADGYTLTANGSANASVAKGQTGTAELTNEYTRDLGSLEITKSFLGDKPADNLLTRLTFKVTGPDSFERELAYPTAFTNGKATLTDLPTGEYSVVESGMGNVVDGTTTYIYDVAGSSTTAGPKSVTKGGTAQVTITNKYTKVEKGSLTVTKSVTVNGGAPAVIAAKAEDKAYQVQIKNEAGKFINAAGEAVENDPGLTVSRTASITINDLPLGKYSISEVSADVNNVDATLTLDTTSSTTGYTGATAVELTSAAKDATKQLVNVYTYQQPKPDTYKVYISKADALSGDEIAGATIVLTKPDRSTVQWTSTTTAHTLDLEEGTYSFVETVEPKGYEKVTTAVEFKVEKDETVAAGYKVTLITVSGSVEQKADGTIVLLDAPKKGSLAITKKVSSDTGNVPAKDSFKVTVYNATKQLYVTDAQGTTSATKTTIDVPLAGLTINTVPLGEYVVEEDINDAANVTGFSFDKESSTFAARTEVKVDAANTVVNGKADLENIYTEVKGALKIKKTVGGDKTSKTSFKVTVQNAAGKYVKADGTLSDTAVLLDVKVDGGLTINNLLAGKYTIKEDTADINVEGYDRTGGVTTTEATVVKGSTTEAELVNNYKKKNTGKISVHVTEEKSGLDVPDATVVITDQDGKKTTYKTNEKGEVVDKDGKIPTVPSGEYTITVSDVPTGYDVKTGEVGKVVVPKDGEGHHEAVIATDRGGIIITVYDEETNEVVSGAKVVVKTPSGEEKEFITDENGQITEYAKKDQFGNYTSEVGEYKYTVTEVPEGYRVTTGKEQTAKVETSKLTELEAKIAPKTGGLDIKVIDQKTKAPVPNATVEVTYPDGTVHEFKTDKDGMIRDLAEKKNGKYTAKVGTYKIKVTKVPEGYSVKTGVETTETIEVDTLKHHVAEIATATEKTVQTGDDTPIALLIMLMLMSAAGAAYVVIRKRREN